MAVVVYVVSVIAHEAYGRGCKDVNVISTLDLRTATCMSQVCRVSKKSSMQAKTFLRPSSPHRLLLCRRAKWPRWRKSARRAWSAACTVVRTAHVAVSAVFEHTCVYGYACRGSVGEQVRRVPGCRPCKVLALCTAAALQESACRVLSGVL